MRAVLILGLGCALGLFVGWQWLPRPPAPAHAAEGATTPYRCPMHAWVAADQPGQCTICGMTLTAAGRPSVELCGAPLVTLEPATAAIIGVQTVTVAREPLRRTLRVGGTFELDASRRRYVTAWTDGRIDKLYVPSVGAEIRAGEPLMALFSRNLLSAQQELLMLASGAQNSTAAIAEQRNQMKQLGFTAKQLDDLIAYREPSSTPVILSPDTGTVIAKDVAEGQWVRTGDRLFEIADLSSLWFAFTVPAVDRAWVRVGHSVEISAGATTLTAPITFLDPTLDPRSGTLRARADIMDTVGLALGQFAEGRITIELPATLVVPRSAVLDTGAGPLVWIERVQSTYESRALTLGCYGDTHVEVLAGLAEGERVVAQGALLIDAQAQLVPAVSR